MNIGLICGGEITDEVLRKILEYAEQGNRIAKIKALVVPGDKSPTVQETENKLDAEVVSDYRQLYNPDYQIDLIIVLSPGKSIFDNILQTKPNNIRVIGYPTFELLWNIINIENKKLEKRNQEIQAILDGLEEFIVVINPDKTIADTNHSFLEKMGYSREEVIGHKCYEVFQKSNRQCEPGKRNLNCPHDEVFTKGSFTQKIFPRMNNRGELVYIEVSIYPIWEESGQISKVIEVSRDVTQLKKPDQEINKELERMVEERTRELKAQQQKIVHKNKMASLGKLSASVVHEINNPISGLLNLILLIKKIVEQEELDSSSIKSFQHYLELMESETRRISRITSNLLSFSRGTRLEFESVNVNNILEDLFLINNNFLKLNNIELNKQLDEDLPNITGDEGQLKQVFMNLLTNAVEAMEEQDPGILTVSTSRENHYIRITFQDTGLGVPEEYINQVFDPFFSTKSQGKGVGLGMSVAYGIIQQHSGYMYIKSEQGSETEIIVHLPLTQPQTKYE